MRNKFWVALGGALAVASALVADGHVSLADANAIALAFVTAVTVHGVSNTGP